MYEADIEKLDTLLARAERRMGQDYLVNDLISTLFEYKAVLRHLQFSNKPTETPSNENTASVTLALRDCFASSVVSSIYSKVESGGYERVAKLSYELADAMLEARKKV